MKKRDVRRIAVFGITVLLLISLTGLKMPLVKSDTFVWDNIQFAEGYQNGQWIKYPHPDRDYYGISPYHCWDMDGTELVHHQEDYATSQTLVASAVLICAAIGAGLGAIIGGPYGAVVGTLVGGALGIIITYVSAELFLDEYGCIWWWVSIAFINWCSANAVTLAIDASINPSYAVSLVSSALSSLGYIRVGAVTFLDAIGAGDPGDSGGSGGCPYVSAWNGTNFALDNNILPAAEMSNGANVKDYYTLQQPLVPTYQGRSYSVYSMQISEFEHEHDYIDQVKLLAVDHSSSVNVGVSPYGEILTYNNPVPAISAIDNKGVDVLPLLSSVDGNYYQGYNGSYVTLTFAQTDVSNGVKLVIREDGLPPIGPIPIAKCPVYVQVLNASGDWNTVATFQTRIRWATDVINMTGHLPDPQGNFKVRLCFISTDKIDYVGMDTTPQASIQVHEAELMSAISSSQGDVTRLLKSDDGEYAELLPGQQIQLTFKLPTNQTSQRTFIFYSEGHYYTIDN